MATQIVETHSTVLVADDDEYSRDLARHVLSSLGFSNIHVAHDGRDGIRVLAKLQPSPDLIICDIFMPEKDGIEFVTELAARGYQGGLVLVSSGDCQMLEVARQIAVDSGLNVRGAFAKPLQLEELRQALGGRRHSQASPAPAE